MSTKRAVGGMGLEVEREETGNVRIYDPDATSDCYYRATVQRADVVDFVQALLSLMSREELEEVRFSVTPAITDA